MWVCLSFRCNIRYHEVVGFQPLNWFVWNFMGAFFGRKMGMTPWIKHRHVTYQNKEEKICNLQYLVRYKLFGLRKKLFLIVKSVRHFYKVSVENKCLTIPVVLAWLLGHPEALFWSKPAKRDWMVPWPKLTSWQPMASHCSVSSWSESGADSWLKRLCMDLANPQ